MLTKLMLQTYHITYRQTTVATLKGLRDFEKYAQTSLCGHTTSMQLHTIRVETKCTSHRET